MEVELLWNDSNKHESLICDMAIRINLHLTSDRDWYPRSARTRATISKILYDHDMLLKV
jgi:hypothetical protein